MRWGLLERCEQVQTLVNDKRRNQSEQTIADATSGENAALAALNLPSSSQALGEPRRDPENRRQRTMRMQTQPLLEPQSWK